eukprot:TRINITY_DN1648_c0_g1_i1.p3 TRINITY_DN1648_c0_g1~~TRINITY_DN1648_c0_g1_i1.p3  ORF type:complete len:159 (-),score=48.04 TRINITY_DN1648_c0_g1_i1:82-558(-)
MQQVAATPNLIRHPCAVVTTTDGKGRDYGCTVAWSTWASFTPPLVVVSIGHTRATHDAVAAAGKFGLCFLTDAQREIGKYMGTASSRNEDKFASAVVRGHVFRGAAADVPLLDGSSSCLECCVVSEHEAGDHTLFVGRVERAWAGGGAQGIAAADLFA